MTHTLYAYVEGSDLDAIESLLLSRFEAFLASHHWTRATWIVNERHDEDPTLGPGDLPDWDLGLNHVLPDPHNEPRDWFAEIEVIARFVSRLSVQTSRTFVLGIADSQTGLSEDLHTVGAEPNIEELRTMIGAAPPGQ